MSGISVTVRMVPWFLGGLLTGLLPADKGLWGADSPELKKIDPLVRAVDLDVGETAEVALCDGSRTRVTLVDLHEERDSVCFAVRRAVVTVEVDGQRGTLISGIYRLPQSLGKVQIDCSITKGNNENGTPSFWGLEKDARLRLWPAGSPWITPGSFVYPVKQRWFAADTQMANEPVFVDGGERVGKRSIYYHSGLDIGGPEGMVEVIAATDALVVSVGETVLPDHRSGTPVAPRYDVVYLLDPRGWYYRYSHLKEIDKSVAPGRVLRQGERVGWLGKEGGSGGWSHLHFEIKSRQPSGQWGTQEGYAYLWQAYHQQYEPQLIAVARPHHLVWTGESVTLDGSRSWSATGTIARYEWRCSDGSVVDQPEVKRVYATPGRHSEVLKVTDAKGAVSYDFTVVMVADREHPERLIPSVHATFHPSLGVRVGEPITFKVRSFNTTEGGETWDFGDGSPPRAVRSDGNAVKLAPDGYAVVEHVFAKPGDYLVRVEHRNTWGVTAVGHLHVPVGPPRVEARRAQQ